jgi:anti-anti-sigma factor
VLSTSVRFGVGDRSNTVVVPLAEIDLDTAPQLAALLASADGVGTMQVDMSQVLFIDSSGLHALLHEDEQRRKRGVGGVRLVNSTPAVRRLLETTGLSDYFT